MAINSATACFLYLFSPEFSVLSAILYVILVKMFHLHCTFVMETGL